MAKKNDLLLWGGAAVALGVVAVGFLLVRGEPGAPQISLQVIPNEVPQGQPVLASGNIVKADGAPSGQIVFMRVREPSNTYTGTVSTFGPSFNFNIPTSGKPPGDYWVEVSDKENFS